MSATRVLLVEDERIVAMNLRRRLSLLGYDVPSIVATGEEALRAIAAPGLTPDVVLMDINLKGEIDGIETAARIPPELGLPVIYLTAYSDEATLERARLTRPYGYLVKPFSERELHATIQMVLERARAAAAERALREAQKMEAIAQLTGGVAHDFNNLLGVLRGGLELIQTAPSNVERVGRLAGNALAAVERGERMIRQLLMFARRQTLAPEAVDVNQLLSEFEPVLRPALGRSVTFALKLQPGLDCARADPSQFQSAILNLLVNARDAVAGRSDARVSIETGSIRLDAKGLASAPQMEPGEYISVVVSDNGSGIPADKLPHVFEPFFTTKELGKGTGLGLSQVYGFTRESGGHVDIVSRVGEGTAVRLYLPRAAPAATVQAGTAAGRGEPGAAPTLGAPAPFLPLAVNPPDRQPIARSAGRPVAPSAR